MVDDVSFVFPPIWVSIEIRNAGASGNQKSTVHIQYGHCPHNRLVTVCAKDIGSLKTNEVTDREQDSGQRLRQVINLPK